MRLIDATGLVAAGLLAMGVQQPPPSADAVLAELKAGNAHHVAKKYQRPHQTAARQQCARIEPEPAFRDPGLCRFPRAARDHLR